MKHYVRLCRPRFDVVVLEIGAEDDEDAMVMALEKAETVPDSEWQLQGFDEKSYHPHVESCHSDHTIDANVGDDPEAKAEYVKKLQSPEPTECTRYILLLGDTETGEGKVVYEPWFHPEDPQLLEHDIAGDWIESLQDAAEAGLENFERATRQGNGERA